MHLRRALRRAATMRVRQPRCASAHAAIPDYKTIEDAIGEHAAGAPAAAARRGQRRERGNVILGKLEGNNPAGSVKDRPAISMIRRAEERGEIKPGDTLIEATSGNTGIALAMAAAIRGYRMVLIMPEDLSVERAQTMKAFGAELILTPRSRRHGIRARPGRADADATARAACSTSSPTPTTRASTTRPPAPSCGDDTEGRITHFVSAMGTTGTITGVVALPARRRTRPCASSARSPARARASRHPQVAAGLPAEDLRPEARSTSWC